MKTATEWCNEWERDNGPRTLEDLIKEIQLDAWKQGMSDMMTSVKNELQEAQEFMREATDIDNVL